MVVYNFGVALILGAAGIGYDRVGVALWPAVVLHTAMTAWCIWCIVSVQYLTQVEEPENLRQ